MGIRPKTQNSSILTIKISSELADVKVCNILNSDQNSYTCSDL